MYQNWIKYNTETPPKYPQSFTGKERDSETGFSYFGARYYDSDILTGWLSVDPMADKYPGLSPYAYCAWNPIRLVDPDGRDTLTILYNEKRNSYSLNYSKGGNNIIIDSDGNSQEFDNDIDVCQYRFKTIGNNVISAYMVNVNNEEAPIYGFAVENGTTLIRGKNYDMSHNEQSNVDIEPKKGSKNTRWQGYMIFVGGNKFHWGNNTGWSTGCVIAVGNVEFSAETNASGWLTFDLSTSKNACYQLTEYFGGQKGNQNYKFWNGKKAVTRPAITWNGKKVECKWDIKPH